MEYSLENTFLKIVFDRKTGAITDLTNKVTGWQVIRQPKLSMGIRLLIPLETHRNNKVLSENQELTSFKMIDQNDVEKKEAVLVWGKLYGDKSGELNVSVKLTVRLQDDVIQFDAFIENHSPYVVEEFWCPCIGGLREPALEEPFESLTMNMCGGFQRTHMGDGFPQSCGYWGTNNPTFISTFPGGGVTLPFVILTNGKQGIYLGMHDETYQLVSFIHELKPGFTDSMHNRVPKADEIAGKPAGYILSSVRLPFVQPGESVELAPMVLRLFSGDWHNGIKTYSNWRLHWYNQRPQPEWLDNVDCWMTLHMNSPEGCCLYRYVDLADIAKEAVEQGVQAIQLIGWARDGQDGAEPYQDIDQRLGTREELKQAIKAIESMGIRVLLMCKFKWADKNIPEYEMEMEQYAVKDMNGNPMYFGGYAYQTLAQQLGLNIRNGVGLCHLSKEYRAVALREFQKLIDLGSSGMLYDELLAFPICFDKAHEHRYGECTFNGSLQLAQDFYALARKTNQNFLFAGEGPDDHLAQYYAVNYIRTSDYYYWVSKHTPAWKYMNPDMKMATCVIGFDDREMINQCMAYGYIINYEPYNFKGRITDIHDTVMYGKKAQRLRKKLWEYLWRGRFLDTDGVSLKSQQCHTDHIYTVFCHRTDETKAVVVVNNSQETDLFTTVHNGQEEQKYDLFSIENETVVVSNGSVKVAPRSFVVLVEKRNP